MPLRAEVENILGLPPDKLPISSLLILTFSLEAEVESTTTSSDEQSKRPLDPFAVSIIILCNYQYNINTSCDDTCKHSLS